MNERRKHVETSRTWPSDERKQRSKSNKKAEERERERAKGCRWWRRKTTSSRRRKRNLIRQFAPCRAEGTRCPKSWSETVRPATNDSCKPSENTKTEERERKREATNAIDEEGRGGKRKEQYCKDKVMLTKRKRRRIIEISLNACLFGKKRIDCHSSVQVERITFMDRQEEEEEGEKKEKDKKRRKDNRIEKDRQEYWSSDDTEIETWVNVPCAYIRVGQFELWMTRERPKQRRSNNKIHSPWKRWKVTIGLLFFVIMWLFKVIVNELIVRRA